MPYPNRHILQGSEGIPGVAARVTSDLNGDGCTLCAPLNPSTRLGRWPRMVARRRILNRLFTILHILHILHTLHTLRAGCARQRQPREDWPWQTISR